MKRTSLLSVVAAALAVLAAGCPAETKPPPPAKPKVTTRPVKKPVKKKPPPPVCVAQSEQAVIGMSSAEDGLVSFCVADGNGESQCYEVELERKKYERLPKPPLPQPATLATPAARVRSTASEVRVCVGDGDTCKSLKPKVKAGENPIEAAINSQGTMVAMLLGDADAGKGVAEVWSVGKKTKKLGTIKYAKGDYRCGTANVLDDLVFVSAGVCAGPAARGALYSPKGKKVADVGGKDFGTYNTVPVEIGDHRWAFLSETGGVIAIHDSKTGKLEKTIDLLTLWSGATDDEAATPAGNPGESVLLRGGDGKLLVVTGSPRAGNIGVVDIEGGTVDVIPAVVCPAAKKAAADDEDVDHGSPDEDTGGSDDGDGGGGSGDDAPPADEPITDL